MEAKRDDHDRGLDARDPWSDQDQGRWSGRRESNPRSQLGKERVYFVAKYDVPDGAGLKVPWTPHLELTGKIWATSRIVLFVALTEHWIISEGTQQRQ